jgi:hypothetical protein
MATLTTIYWLCFGIGLVYVVVAGALGMVTGGLEGGADSGLDIDTDVDVDVDLDTDLDTGFDVDTSMDIDVDSELDAGGFDGGFDADHGADFSFDNGHPVASAGHEIGNAADFPGFSLLSPLSIAGFLFAFGGAGLVSLFYSLPLIPGIALAAAGGAGMMTLMWLVIGKLLYSLQGSSEAHQGDMIGLEAEVITPLETGRSGEISYILSGVRYTAPARLEGEGRINKRETVRIRRMKDNVVYVVPKKKLLN